MSNILRNIVAVVAGFVVGSIVNGTLITLSPSVIPPPPGVDINNAESLANGIHLFEVKHFIMPFLAHALGAFFGALAAFIVAGSHKIRFAYAIGALFLCGGIAASYMIPAPAWFIGVDLVFAYLPMAWLAGLVGGRIQRKALAQPATPV